MDSREYGYLSRLVSAAMADNTSVTVLVGAGVATTLALWLGCLRLLRKRQQKIIQPSPRVTVLPRLSPAQRQALPYPPDVLPGGRDVDSPYGAARVYEWGPEGGRKVLLIHGITTPCIALGAVAHGLVQRGCRVMLLDLWGRGYSDSCADLPHDDRLYTTEILIALTSSPLSWTGGPDGGFCLVGYSLGGGISVAFTSHFSNLVKSLVLVAPSGIMRPEHMSMRSKLLYSTGIFPESLLRWLVKKRLQAGPLKRAENKATRVVGAETESDASVLKHRPLSDTRPDLTTEAAVAWQLEAHEGFVHSFMSSIRYAPVTGNEATWQRLGRLRSDKILIFAGASDPIIIAPELEADAKRLLGADKVQWKLVDGAHDFPTTHSEELVQEMCAFWGM